MSFSGKYPLLTIYVYLTRGFQYGFQRTTPISFSAAKKTHVQVGRMNEINKTFVCKLTDAHRVVGGGHLGLFLGFCILTPDNQRWRRRQRQIATSNHLKPTARAPFIHSALCGHTTRHSM